MRCKVYSRNGKFCQDIFLYLAFLCLETCTSKTPSFHQTNSLWWSIHHCLKLKRGRGKKKIAQKFNWKSRQIFALYYLLSPLVLGITSLTFSAIHWILICSVHTQQQQQKFPICIVRMDHLLFGGRRLNKVWFSISLLNLSNESRLAVQ
jgi:hypothetical protein